jgi:hypothetical protein
MAMTLEKANPAPKTGTKGFKMHVLPSREQLDKAIADNGFCEPAKCWHKVAIHAIALAWTPKDNPKVMVDAGHIKMNYRGYRYVADTPRHVKRSLMLFDKGLYDQVYIRGYSLRFHRRNKIVPVSAKRQAQINQARLKRIAEGGDENKRKYPNLRKRVEGFSASV